MTSISKRVYVDDPAYPSEPGSTSDATISVVHQRHIFFEEIDGHGPSHLKMTVRDPIMLGLKCHEEPNLNAFFERMLMTCNLHMEHMRLSTVAADTELVGVYRDRPLDNANVERKLGRIEATVNIAVSIRPMLEIHGTENLDETKIIGTLKMIHAVYDSPNPSAKVANLKESLKAYHSGIKAHDRNVVLKELYIALEKAGNFGKDVVGAKFDSETRTLVGDPTLQIDRIRNACDRLKHYASEKQLPDYPDTATVSGLVKELRPAAVKAILLRLKEVAGQP